MSDATDMIARCGAGQRDRAAAPEPPRRGPDLHTFRFVLDELGRGEASIDGRPLIGVRAVTLGARVGHLTTVTLEVLGRLEVEGRGAVTEITVPVPWGGGALETTLPVIVPGRRGAGRWYHVCRFREDHVAPTGWSYEACRCGARQAVALGWTRVAPDRAWLFEDGAPA
jgi:hypothetical protein